MVSRMTLWISCISIISLFTMKEYTGSYFSKCFSYQDVKYTEIHRYSLQTWHQNKHSFVGHVHWCAHTQTYTYIQYRHEHTQVHTYTGAHRCAHTHHTHAYNTGMNTHKGAHIHRCTPLPPVGSVWGWRADIRSLCFLHKSIISSFLPGASSMSTTV